jgi:hypothetical protein
MGASVVTVGGTQIWVLGGCSKGSIDTVDVYDLVAGAWRPAGIALPTPRDAARAVVVGPELYVLGGVADGAALNRVDILDMATLRWIAAPPMPTPRAFHAAQLF